MSIGPSLDVDFLRGRPAWLVDFFANSALILPENVSVLSRVSNLIDVEV